MEFLYGYKLPDISPILEREAAVGVTFPEKYKNIVLEHDGASLEPAGCRFVNPQTGAEEVIECNSFIPFVANPDNSFTMSVANSGGIPNLPLGLVVFAQEAGGYLFGFDYTGHILGNQSVPVVLIHLDNEPEYSVIQVADSFDEFL